MTKKDATTEMRRCIGSKTFGIEPHEAAAADFPTQPSQKDGLGRMCKPHWRQYTNALRKAAVARAGAEAMAHNEAMDAREAAAPGSLTDADVKDLGAAVDAAITREAKREKAATKRERRRTPMAHLPTDVAPSVAKFIADAGGNLPPAKSEEDSAA